MHRTLTRLLILALVFSLLPWPPFDTQVAHATTCGFGSDIGGGQCRGYLTTTGGSTWTVPNDWNSSSNTIEAIGAGASGASSLGSVRGGGGGGGGAYASITNLSLTAGASISYTIGAGNSGTDTQFKDGSTLVADAGSAALGPNGGAGGTIANSIGSTKNAGGNGGNGDGGAGLFAGGGGGGAGGIYGTGANGGAGLNVGGGGGGGGGGTAGSNTGVGGNNHSGTGGGSADSNGSAGGGGGGDSGSGTAGTGGDGTEWDATHGSGGGGGAGRASVGASAGSYGAGGGGGGGAGGTHTGGAGTQGLIVITYTPGGGGGETPWYDTDWSNRVSITVQHGEVDNDLTDFPVYVDLSDMPTGFWSTVRSDCGDIRVTSSDGTTEVPREVASCDTSGETGELHFKAPSLSSSVDTVFYIYYGNASASDYTTNATYGAQNVWDGNYVGVWHMSQKNVLDSTAFANNGTASGNPSLITGKVGEGIDFNGSTDFITVSNSSSLMQPNVSNRVTISSWINVTTNNSSYREIARKGSTGNAWFFLLNVNNKLSFSTAGNSSEYDAGVAYAADSQWHYVTATYDGSTIRVYVDGAQVTSFSGGAISNNTDPFVIAALGSSIQLFDGSIDELELSAVARSTEWISAEYNNQNSPATFMSIGSEETPDIGDEVPARILRLKGGIRLKGHVRLF